LAGDAEKSTSLVGYRVFATYTGSSLGAIPVLA